MAAGKTIEKLSLSLGLNMTQLDTDFITAGKSVNQGMSDLSRKAQQSKLKMDIDMSRFPDAEKSVEALILKEKHLTDQLNIQRQAVALTNTAYQESVRAKGADDVASQKLLTRLLREQKAEADLAGQIQRTNTARGKLTTTSLPPVNTGQSTNALNSLTGALGQVRTAGSNASGQIASLNSKMIGLAAAAAGGYGLFSFVKGVVDAGDAAYKLSMRLSLSSAEAGALNRTLGLANVDTQMFISTMTRLDRSVTTAGKNGNTLTDSMKLFGFSLTDANGSLLPMNQQLEQLAIGYKNAAQAGEEEAFAAEVLGAKGAALIPLLQEFNDLKAVNSQTKLFGGVDPKEAHEMALQMKVLNAEANQFKNVLGVALFPIVKELIPYLEDGLGTTVAFMKDNKEAIVETSKSVGELVEAAAGLAKVTVVPVLEWIVDNKGTIVKAFEDITDKIRVITEHPLVSILEMKNPIPNQMFVNPYLKQYKEEREAAKESAAARRKELAEKNKSNSDSQKTIEDLAKKEQEVKARAISSERANAKARTELADEVFKASHSQLEIELHDIDLKKQKMLDELVDETTATEIANAKKKIIIDKNNLEIKKSTEQLSDEIFKLTHSSLENRLRDIEREKQEWIKKTNDEVKATELAEKQKQKAIADSVMSTLQGKKEELQIAIDLQKKLSNISQSSIGDADTTAAYRKDATARAIAKAKQDMLNLKMKGLGDNVDNVDSQTFTLVAELEKGTEEYIANKFRNMGAAAGQEFGSNVNQSILEALQSAPGVSQAMINANAPSNAGTNSKGNINVNTSVSVEFKGFTGEEVNKAVEQTKEAVAKEIHTALQDAGNQYGV